MRALCAALLESSFEEGADFLLYSYTAKDLDAATGAAVERLLQADLRGVFHAANSMMCG